MGLPNQITSSPHNYFLSWRSEETPALIWEAEETAQVQETPDTSDKQLLLTLRNLGKTVFQIRKKRAVTRNNATGASIPAAASGSTANSNPPIAVENVYQIFQDSAKGKNRASFTPEQGQRILDFYRQENDDAAVSIYRKIFDSYRKIENFKELAWEFDAEFKSIDDKSSPKSIEDYVIKKGEDRNAVAEKLLFKLKSAEQFFSDLLSKDIYTTEPVVRIFQDTNDQMRFRNSILLMSAIQRYHRQLLNGDTNSRVNQYRSIIHSSIDKLSKSLHENKDVLKRAFTKYSELKKKTDCLAVSPAIKDCFAAISQFINHPDAQEWMPYPSLKRKFVFNLSRFFHQKNLIKPKELDNQRGPDFEKIDDLVQNAVKKYKSSLGPEHNTYSDLELRVYLADKTKYVTIHWQDVKHVMERHYSPTFNPSASKNYNTKFRSEMTLDKIVKTIYERINTEKNNTFGSPEEYHAITFSIDGQMYQIGIDIPGNKKIREGNKKIAEGRGKKTAGEQKRDQPNATKKEQGEGNHSIKLGEKWILEGQKLVEDGTARNLQDRAYNFKQFYPEPRNAVVLVMSRQDVTNPENNTHLRNLLAAFGRRYCAYRIPATYYALVFHEDSTFEMKRLTSDPASAATEKWTWAPHQESLKGVYNKVVLAGYGNHDPKGGVRVQEGISNASTRAIDPDMVGNAFATLFSGNASEIQRIRLLACHQKAEVFGEAIRKSLKKKSVKMEQIIGSEADVYIANNKLNSANGIKPASKHYINAEEIQQTARRGVEEIKWVLDIDSNGDLKGAPKRFTSHGDSGNSIDIAAHSDAISGPFGKKAIEIALNLQQAARSYSEAKRQISESLATIDSTIGEVKELASRLFKKVSSAWFVAIDKVRPVEQGYVIHALEKDSSTWKEIPISKERGEALIAARERLKTASEFLKPYFEKGPDGYLRAKSGIQSSSHPNTLNGGFLAVALISRLGDKDAEMSLETKVSIYLRLAGAATAVMGDIWEVGKLIASGGVVQRSLQTVSSFFEATNTIFMLGDLGYNIYQLATVKDPVARVGIGIQTGFTVGAVVLQGGTTFVAWAVPAFAETSGTIGIFAGPVMALGIGFSALGVQIKQHNMSMHALFTHLLEAKKAYQSGGFEKSGDVLIPKAHAVITKLDFNDKKVTFGSQQIKKSKYEDWFKPSSPYDFQAHQWERFNLREAFGIPETYEFDTETPDILLPATPNISLDYEHINVWPSMSAEEEYIGNELDRTGNFASKNSVGDLRPALTSSNGIRFHPLKLDVILDNRDHNLWFNHEINENMSYDIQGGGGNVTLRGLHSGVRLTLREQGEKQISSFSLEVPVLLLNENDVSLNGGILTIKEAPGKLIRVDVSRFRGTLRIAGTATCWNVDLDAGKISLATLDLRRTEDLARTFDSYIRYLKSLADKGRTGDVVQVIQGPFPRNINQNATSEEKTAYWQQIQQANVQATHSAYDSKKNDVICPRSPIHNVTALKGSKLIGAREKRVFFFNSEKGALWDIDRETSKVTYHELRFINESSQVETVAKIGNQHVAKQSSLLDGGNGPADRVNLFHILEEDKIRLVGVNGFSNERFKNIIRFLQNLKRSEALRTVPGVYDTNYAFEQATGLCKKQALPEDSEYPNIAFRRAEIPEWLPIEGLDEDGFPQKILADFKKGYMVCLNSYQISNLQLVKSWVGEGKPDTFLFWSPENGKAYFARAEAETSKLSLSEVDTDGKRIVWYGPNENTDKVDFVAEGGEDIITVDQQRSAVAIMETLTPEEWDKRNVNVPLSA